jgi:hypothetical protein
MKPCLVPDLTIIKYGYALFIGFWDTRHLVNIWQRVQVFTTTESHPFTTGNSLHFVVY